MFKLEIVTENAAFESEPQDEVARILRDLASKFVSDPGGFESGAYGYLKDINGNTVGNWDYIAEETDS